jgi:hypothetical protein
MAVTEERSAGVTVPWAAMMGTWSARPIPAPARIWYPIQCDDELVVFKVYNNPDPIVAIMLPAIMKGTKCPKAVIIPPEIMVEIVTARMRGRFRTPEFEAETPDTAWK